MTITGSGRSRYIEGQIARISHYWVGTILLLGSILFICLSGLDYLAARSHFREFLLFRIAIAAVLFLWFLALKRFDREKKDRRLQYILILTGTFLSSAVVEMMILKLGGSGSTYYAGLNLIVILVLGFVPLRMTESALCVSIIYLTYLVPILVFDRVTSTGQFAASNAFLISTFLISLVWRALNQRSLINSLGLQYELDMDREQLAAYSSGLERLVEERTRDLNKSEVMFRSLFENATDAIMLLDTEGVILNVNSRACEMHNMEACSLVGTDLAGLDAEENRAMLKDRLRSTLAGESLIYETRHFKKDGGTIVLEASSRAVQVNGGVLIQCFYRDITEKKRLQEQLLQSQKMESIGQLAGGIAHDFNNVLAAILGNVELIVKREAVPPGVLEKVRRIEAAARKAVQMISKLLSFARRSNFEPAALDLNEVVEEALDLVKRLIPDKIRVEKALEAGLHFIRGDVVQMDQMLMNLVLNARDAMPEGGSLVISTELVQLTSKNLNVSTQVVPGAYVKLTVSDSGTGIRESDLPHIFEPFYTTKEKMKGMGLGLAMVYGIVKGHQGYITVDSVPGAGTRFEIYIPAAPEYVSRPACGQEEIPMGSGETVLVIDDDRSVLEFTCEALASRGFNTFSSDSAMEGLSLYGGKRDEIDLVITDLVMPEMDGVELAKEIKGLNPDARIISMSAFNDLCKETGADALLKKPFSVSKLLLSVNKALQV